MTARYPRKVAIRGVGPKEGRLGNGGMAKKRQPLYDL